MRTEFGVLLVGVSLVAGSAQACSRSFSLDLDFRVGSAELEKQQVVKLVNWIDSWRSIFSRYERVEVDGIAPAGAENARLLARRRAEAVSRALDALLEGGPVRASTHLAPSASVFKGGNYASLDLVPFQADLSDCNPVPIPGFKR